MGRGAQIEGKGTGFCISYWQLGIDHQRFLRNILHNSSSFRDGREREKVLSGIEYPSNWNDDGEYSKYEDLSDEEYECLTEEDTGDDAV